MELFETLVPSFPLVVSCLFQELDHHFFPFCVSVGMNIPTFNQEMETTVVDGNGTEAGHIIVTTIGGRNGQPKQVSIWNFSNIS